MIEKFTTKVSINTKGEAIRFAKECYEEAAEKYAEGKSSSSVFQEAHKKDFIEGAKWQQEQIGKSEFLQKLRATLSDAEAKRLIFEQFKKK